MPSKAEHTAAPAVAHRTKKCQSFIMEQYDVTKLKKKMFVLHINTLQPTLMECKEQIYTFP